MTIETKFTLQTMARTKWSCHWFTSSHDSYMPETTYIWDVVNWLKTIKLDSTREYRLLSHGIPLVEFNVDNLWILETYI